MGPMTELFRDGDWVLGTDAHDTEMWTVSVFISHIPCGGGIAYGRFWVDTECPICREEPPAAMVGMRNMTEWDR